MLRIALCRLLTLLIVIGLAAICSLFTCFSK